METFQYTITDEIGIHARPAGELAKLAVMALGIRHGQTVTVEVFGADEEEAAEAVQDFFQAKL